MYKRRRTGDNYNTLTSNELIIMQLKILTQKIDKLENKLENLEQLRAKIALNKKKRYHNLKSQLVIKHNPITNYYS